jgi:[NiFe] hydrogenase diaphorase moiety large subunit
MDVIELETILAEEQHHPHYLLQMLRRVQEKENYISPSTMAFFAEKLNLPLTKVQGVVSFYSLLNTTPRDYHILFSDNIIEHLQGKEQLMQLLMSKLGIEQGKVRADQRVCVENTSCIGMSDQGISALVNGLTITNLNEQRISEMVDLIEKKVPLSQWSPAWFKVKNNIQRKDQLLNTNFVAGSVLQYVQTQTTDQIMETLKIAAIRGCGGAGFRLDSKWDFCRKTPANERFVVCNADEGEPGTFKDRVLLQNYADLVFEGMTVCAKVIDAKQGFLYLRGEYRYLLDDLEKTLAKRREQQLLGKAILGDSNFNFDIKIFMGAGAYVCGAETALIESLHGNRGVPRKRPPPFPVNVGYSGKPTVVNNVETFSLAVKALMMGGENFAKLGTEQSHGTKLLSISGDCEKAGIYEFPYGVSVREVLEACGTDFSTVQMVQNSGPAGNSLAPEDFERKFAFEDVNTTGSIMIFNKNRDILEVVQNFANFFVHESCGFCTPCRVGTSIIKNLVTKVRKGRGSNVDLKEMQDLSILIRNAAHCGLGMTATNHISDTLKKFPQLYRARLHNSESLHPTFDLDGALEDARQITHRQDANAHL